MSFWSILETVFIGPLKLVFEIIFNAAYRFIGHPGMAIIFLSLIMNILVLPLYKRADAMQEKARDDEMRISKGVTHIKKTFSGDERMMILQTYYRQMGHKPTSALNGSVSLLLEIPFFMAAYQFLSHLDILDGVAFGPIADLGSPDALIVIGGLTINLLPVLMTLINVIASAIYLKGFPMKTKIQLYALAAFFLVFLYNSPACLVFYWTLNNLFSLVKNIFYKLKHPQAVLRALSFIIGVVAVVFGAVFYNDIASKKAVVIVIGALLMLPLVFAFVKSKIKVKAKEKKVSQPSRKLFFLSGLFLTVLVGVLIPSAIISASPQEFVDITYFHNPMWYIIRTACMSCGLFLVWMGVFYWLASEKGKVIFEKMMLCLGAVAFVNYMFFGTGLGNISAMLQYDNGLWFELKMMLINAGVLAAVVALFLLLGIKLKRAASFIMLVAAVAIGGMSALNVSTITTSIGELNTQRENEIPNFNLSKNGENVVVIMLDRAIGEYVPYIFNEKPELAEKFDGFTYYSNVISFGGKTNFGLPPLAGGYEYTPVEMNKRDEESLADKHNEALKVMPVLFSENGYDVTVLDPTYAGYQWVPDLSIYDEYEGIDAYITDGQFGTPAQKQAVINACHRNFFCFSFMKTMPLFLQGIIYDNGIYNQIVVDSVEEGIYTGQTMNSMTSSEGVDPLFMEDYNVILNMENMTNIKDDDSNNFLFMTNDLTHLPTLLQTPDYIPSEKVDNSDYDKEKDENLTVDGKKLNFVTESQKKHYHSNMAALLRLSEWFDYLRENDVYDNTKIILVSDHGHNMEHFEELMLSDNALEDLEMYFPLLLVKEIGSTGFTVSDEFMTNADVPTLATDGLIENPVNPFTGKEINSDEKTAHEQFVILSYNWDIMSNNGNTFDWAKWAAVKDDLWDKDNWTLINRGLVMKDHIIP